MSSNGISSSAVEISALYVLALNSTHTEYINEFNDDSITNIDLGLVQTGMR